MVSQRISPYFFLPQFLIVLIFSIIAIWRSIVLFFPRCGWKPHSGGVAGCSDHGFKSGLLSLRATSWPSWIFSPVSELCWTPPPPLPCRARIHLLVFLFSPLLVIVLCAASAGLTPGGSAGFQRLQAEESFAACLRERKKWEIICTAIRGWFLLWNVFCLAGVLSWL